MNRMIRLPGNPLVPVDRFPPKANWEDAMLEESLAKTAVRRLAGQRASRPQAALAASLAGLGTGIAIYRLLRSGDEER
jgi:hypothetical protein